ncbi:MAG: glycine--tRNA ligase [Candidatus Shapirobacteria bacterium]|nr:glycine--tRNA ligase [Candidatus Shapirobacteria bacterium]
MNNLDKIVSLAKRRGFVFQNSQIYGGVAGIFDYGPLGVEMVNNIKKLWWQDMVHSRANVVGIDGSIITHPKVWKASGHISHFTDPLVDCRDCKKRFRPDDLKAGRCPECGGKVGKPRKFNILVETGLGVIEGKKDTYYLRGEACQNIYLNYDNVLRSTRQKIPFGIAQIGKAFRNEITPKHFLYRQREFEQWDLQFFVNPREAKKWFQYWKEERMAWYKNLINNPKRIRFHKHTDKELAHYAKVAYDIEFKTSFAGWQEWEGVHWRGDWDLSRHGQFSGHDFTYQDPDTGEKFLPWIVETSGGVDRTVLYLLEDAYTEEKIDQKIRVVLKLAPKIAPIKIAVFPLLANKKELVELAKGVFDQLNKKFVVDWDDNGNIGKRYRRQDEIGTPWCLTIDYDTLKNQTVTVRDRNTMAQERVAIDQLIDYFSDKLND